MEGMDDYEVSSRFRHHAQRMTSTELAQSLEYHAPFAITQAARAIMEEAAERLRQNETTPPRSPAEDQPSVPETHEPRGYLILPAGNREHGERD
jgi:hypothetical protein